MARFILEGTDRAGKSTMAEALRAQISRVSGRESRVSHCNRHSALWHDPDDVMRVMRGADVIDRLYESEAIYSEVVRGGRSLSDGQLDAYRDMQACHGAVTVIITAPEHVIRDRYLTSDGEYVDVETALAVQRRYIDLFVRHLARRGCVRLCFRGDESCDELAAIASQLVGG